jgi:hypothetical protein
MGVGAEFQNSAQSTYETTKDVFWEDRPLDTRLLWDAIDSDPLLKEEESFEQTAAVGAATVVATALSAGYFLWSLRGGCLLASFLSSVPAWRMMDPLPILEDFQQQTAGAAKTDEEDEEESLQSMLAGNR